MKRKRMERPKKEDWIVDIEDVALANEQTGLMPTPPQSEEEAEAYRELIPTIKPKPID